MSAYISDCLIHFVGRKCPDDDSRYALLKDIIAQGYLTSSPGNKTRDPNITFSPESFKTYGEITINQVMVCFCDIPDECLDRHTRNYGKFGLAFAKPFMVRMGARPVHYIPSNGLMHLYPPDINKNYPAEPESFYACFAKNFIPFVVLGGMKMGKEYYPFSRSLLANMPFLKFFDETLSEDDPKNYYYEREWRLLGYLDFKATDIAKVYLPETYLSRLQTDLPSLAAQIIPL